MPFLLQKNKNLESLIILSKILINIAINFPSLPSMRKPPYLLDLENPIKYRIEAEAASADHEDGDN
jgi:hypothetical protein